MATVISESRAEVCPVQSMRFERRNPPKVVDPAERHAPIVIGVIDASWADACRYARQVFHTDELLDRPVPSTRETVNPDGETFVAKAESPDVILRWVGSDAGNYPDRRMVVLVPSAPRATDVDPVTVREIVRWMRDEYPLNRHAKSWANEIEKKFGT